jgi:DNA-binding MarR family transcriptional regulator
LSFINKENAICIRDTIKTILAIYEKDVNCIETPNTIGTNISKILGITLGTLTTNIDRLCEKGYVSRDKSEKDKRIF